MAAHVVGDKLFPLIICLISLSDKTKQNKTIKDRKSGEVKNRACPYSTRLSHDASPLPPPHHAGYYVPNVKAMREKET